ncbi:MAG: sulfatase-like hydrolase/transferase [Acholeplasma sp.]|nr:sulfatase-like hydrolase/transferase [Acholeplasma sp.]
MKTKNFIVTILSLVLVVSFPISNLYFRNFTLVKFSEVGTTFAIYMAVALVITGLALLFLKDISKAGLVGNISMLFMMMFRSLERGVASFFPFIQYWHLVYLFITAMILIAIWINKKIDLEVVKKANQITEMVFGLLFITNLALALPKIIPEIKKSQLQNEQTPTLITQGHEPGKENIYIFLFDEFSGLDGAERYTGFDNSKFYEELEEMGFNTSPHSHNKTTKTAIEVPNLLNLSLVLNYNNYNINTKEEYLRNASLFSLYQQNGYYVYVINDQNYLPEDTRFVDKMDLGQSASSRAETFLLTTLKNSIIYPYYTQKEDARIQEIKNLFDLMKNSPDIQDKKQFTFGYFVFPHNPWVLDEKGNPIERSERLNWRNTDAYLGQYKYTSKEIVKLGRELINKDPDSIILFLSDHGYRLPDHLENLYNEIPEDPELEFFYQTNILNAVYYKGQELDIDQLSAVDTLITVVNKQLSTNIPLVERDR